MNRLRQAWPPGVRLQLLFWYTTIFAGVLLLAGLISYHYFETSLENSVDQSLHIQAQQIAQEMIPGDDVITIHDATGILSHLDRDHPSSQGVDIDYGGLVRLLNARGDVMRQTPASDTLIVPGESVTQPMRGHTWEGTTLTTTGVEVRLYSQAVTVQGKIFAIVQVGQSLSNVHHVLQRLTLVLLAVGGVALVICALSSYWLTGRAFAPVQRLIQTARRIKAGDLRQRVSIPPARDELQFLAVTLNEMLDSLDQMVSRQRRFVADASHELRTPVAVIRNKTSMALLHPQSVEEYAAIIQGINTETERLGHLLNDLLALSRGDEGRAKFEQERVRLDLLAKATVTQTEWLAEERGIGLSIQANQPVEVIGDEARFIQVLLNLLDNALHYTPSGGSVQVVVEVTSHVARLIVRDTGIGIAPEHLPHIFERFYRADPAREQSNRSNSGLGLAIVDWIIRAHAGSIAVESKLKEGTCFTVSLPLAPTQPRERKGQV